MRTFRAGVTLLFGCFTLVLPRVLPGSASGGVPWEWSPYRICVHFSVSDSARTTLHGDADEILERLRPQLQEVVGNGTDGLWELDFRTGAFPEELFFDRALKESIPRDDPRVAALLAEKYDKHVYVTIDSDARTLRVRSREIDLPTLFVQESRSFEAGHREDVPRALFSAMRSSFAPVALLNGVSGDRVTLRLRGGELSPSPIHETVFTKPQTGNSFPEIGPGDVFIPYLKFRTKNDENGSVAPVPWTALVVVSAGNRLVQCTLESGIRHPLNFRRRATTEHFAVLFRPDAKPTRIRLAPRMLRGRDATEAMDSTDAGRGYPVFFSGFEIMETFPGSDERLSLGNVARDGTLLIPYRHGNTVRRICVKDGKIPIARIPIVQGWKSSFTVALPDDPVRIEAEGFLTGLQEELIDHVAYRDILVSRIMHFEADGRDKDALEQARTALHSQKTPLQFRTEIENARRRYTSEDPIVQRRIERMFTETQNIVERFLAGR